MRCFQRVDFSHFLLSLFDWIIMFNVFNQCFLSSWKVFLRWFKEYGLMILLYYQRQLLSLESYYQLVGELVVISMLELLGVYPFSSYFGLYFMQSAALQLMKLLRQAWCLGLLSFLEGMKCLNCKQEHLVVFA